MIEISTSLCWFWVVTAVALVLAQFIMSTTSDYVPKFVKELYLFGKLKSSLGKPQGMDIFLVPKRWFWHFYSMGLTVHTLAMLCTFLHLCGWLTLSDLLPQLSFSWQSLSNVPKDKIWPCSLIVLLMEWFQLGRRLYECLFISTFSNSTMSLLHYFLGTFLYTSFGIGLLLQMDLKSHAFRPIESHETVLFAIGLLLFALASLGQHKAMVTFAALRKGKKDNPKLSHHIPEGHLFEWISSPHYLCEILIYLSMNVVFGFRNIYLISILAFVLATQGCSSVLVHDWYKKNFANYPPNRKAIIPCVF